MIWGRKNRKRRDEIRRQRAESRPSAWRTFRDEYGASPLLIGLGLYVATTAVILSGGQTMPWQVGQYVPGDVRARVAFSVRNEQEEASNRKYALLATPDIYVRNEAVLTGIAGRLMELYALAKSSEDSARFIEQAKAKGWVLDERDYAALRTAETEATKPAVRRTLSYQATVESLRAYLQTKPLVEKPRDKVREGAPLLSVLRWDGGERLVNTADLQYVTKTADVERIAEEAASIYFKDALAPLQTDVRRFIVQSLQADPEKERYEPIYRFDSAATAALIKQKVDALPQVINYYTPGDVLAKGGSIITQETLYLLRAEHKKYREDLSTDGTLWRAYALRRIGTATIIFLVIVGLAVYTFAYQHRNLQKPMRVFGLAALLLGMLALARLNGLVQLATQPLPKEFTVAIVVIAAAVLTIVYEQRYAFGVTGGLAILATLAVEGDFGLFIALLTPMSVTVFLLKDIRTRGKLIAAGALAAVAAFIAAAAAGLTGGQRVNDYVLPHAAAAAGAAFLAGFIVLGVLPAVERLFGVATSLTLLEWCDASKPLLRRLAQEAPGTHNHSLMLGTIAEAAADAIGANGLLTRVGALYHDIGKTAKPEYYVENQEARINRHDRLGPTLSLLVIVSHVKDGLEMAREYGLPKVLHQFIAEHHGTTVVRYFHRLAAEQARKSRSDELPESEFRYPGPKPRSRETAVLMICDSVEGAVRALPEPTPGRIETTVHQILMDRLDDGQFDDCDITMKDLSRIEEAVVKALCAVYHGRIKYPSQPKEQRPRGNGQKADAPPEARAAAPTSVPAAEAVLAGTGAARPPAPESAPEASRT